MQTEVRAAFAARFGRPPAIVVRAPGRVNLLGGHTDYNEGYVLPVAIDRAAWVAAAPAGGRESRVYALDMEEEATFSLSPVPPAQGNWADYPRAVAWAWQEWGMEPVGLEAVLTSDVPVGAGLSSSAAVEVAFALAWQRLSGLALDRRDLALLCQRAENGYVGVNCGVLDQMASLLGAEGHALMLDCRTLETALVPLPQGVAIVVADTGVRRRLASSEYNVRRAQCEQAVGLLRPYLPAVRALRDVSLDDLARLKTHLPEVVYRRARHVVGGNARVLRAVAALRAGDVATVGQLMNDCHVSLRDDYQVSAPELDVLAEAAWEVEGCYGARLTGAGFGGCVVALVAADGAPELETHLALVYESTFGRRPVIYTCHSSAGALTFDV